MILIQLYSSCLIYWTWCNHQCGLHLPTDLIGSRAGTWTRDLRVRSRPLILWLLHGNLILIENYIQKLHYRENRGWASLSLHHQYLFSSKPCLVKKWQIVSELIIWLLHNQQQSPLPSLYVNFLFTFYYIYKFKMSGLTTDNKNVVSIERAILHQRR